MIVDYLQFSPSQILFQVNKYFFLLVFFVPLLFRQITSKKQSNSKRYLNKLYIDVIIIINSYCVIRPIRLIYCYSPLSRHSIRLWYDMERENVTSGHRQKLSKCMRVLIHYIIVRLLYAKQQVPTSFNVYVINDQLAVLIFSLNNKIMQFARHDDSCGYTTTLCDIIVSL